MGTRRREADDPVLAGGEGGANAKDDAPTTGAKRATGPAGGPATPAPRAPSAPGAAADGTRDAPAGGGFSSHEGETAGGLRAAAPGEGRDRRERPTEPGENRTG